MSLRFVLLWVINVQHSSMPELECVEFDLYEGISMEIILIARF